MFDGKGFTHFNEKEGLSNSFVLSIMEDSHGNIWFGTYGGGVSMFDGANLPAGQASFTHFTEREGLSKNIVWTIMEDSHGNIWFGTYGGGAGMFDGTSITHFTDEEGLSNNTVQSILEDNNGNIWISTEQGLNLIVFDPDSVYIRYNNPVIHNFGHPDGLKAMDFLLNSVLLDSKNRIWWGSSKSLIMLDMNKFKIPLEPPDMHLNRIEINEQFADYRQFNESIEIETKFIDMAKFYNYALNLELPYNNNHLTFHFSAIDWSAPHKLLYSYKMEGLNKGWSSPSKETKADYRTLPHGSYTFKVRAIGGAQKWSEPFEYTFTILPPWWHTWWARAGYGITIILIIYGFARWRTNKLKQRQKELEAEVVNATQIIRTQKEEIESHRDEVLEANEELEVTLENLKVTQSQLIQSEKIASVGILTAGIAHELNNPINFVSSNINPLLRDVNDVFTIIEKYDDIVKSNKLEGTFDEVDKMKVKMDFSFLIKEIINLLEGIEEGASRSSQIVKGLRSFSRLDEEKCELYDIHEGIDSSLILLHNKIKGRITVGKDYGNFKDLECFPSKLNQVLMNILTNSIQAIEGKGKIFIKTSSTDNKVRISIKDTGKGMTPEIKKHIFDPFFSTKDVGEGTGLGLSISYGIIDQHKGDIDVISEPGKGTEFIISLPKTQSDLT
jgi:signal transduction histidine kinase